MFSPTRLLLPLAISFAALTAFTQNASGQG
jgi:hypothetical protein